MNRRILQSPSLNLPTYPGEFIYVPDMLVAIVALSDYARQYNGKSNYCEELGNAYERGILIRPPD